MIARVYHYTDPETLNALTLSQLEALLIDAEGVSVGDPDA